MRNFTQDEAKVIYNDAKSKGLDPNKVMSHLVLKGATFEGIDMNQAKQYAQSQVPQTTPENPTLKERAQGVFQDIKQVGTDVAESSMKRSQNISEIRGAMESGQQGDVRSILQTAGQLAGAGADAITATGKGLVNIFLNEKQEKDLTSWMQENIGERVMSVPIVQKAIAKYQSLPPEQQRDVQAIASVLDLASNFVGGQAISKGTDVIGTGAKKTIQVAGDVVDTTGKTIKNTANAIVPATKEGFINFVTPNVDESVKTILKTTPTDKFDEVVRIAQDASVDPTKPSTYEFVAKSMTDATKQIDNQVKSLAQQKNTIISKAKTGLTDFQKETGQIILDINRGLKDSELGKSFITRLKQVKSKIDADRAIDDLQDVLYKGNKDMTIPVGSSEDKLLKGILGKYNTTLKSSLPISYGNINTQISNRIKALNILNRSLGEVVDGVPVRGAGLVKQFFSPAGTKTKQLFDYIKKTTGVDLAQDAVLAKYIGEAFGDTKIKSLLEGVPTTKTGAIDRVIDFALEKTGATGALQKAKKSGLIKKARELTVEK